MSAGKKVVILGGGIAGMSAAQELIERGFEVEVFERKSVAGGKARSIAATGISAGLSPFGPKSFKKARLGPPRSPLPGEHGFRFFPGFYKHVIDTMARIPYQGGVVADNLVNTTELRITLFDRPSYVVPAQSPRTSDDLKTDIFAIIIALSGRAGVAFDDGLFFATKTWEFITSCEERRLVEYERINWWDFIEAGSRSAAYQKFFGNGITRSLVAAKARRASAKTIGDIFVQIAFEILLPGVAADRVLNGPTSDVWINPWLEHLRRLGVTYHLDADVRSIRCEKGLIRGATIAVGNSLREVSGDYVIGALPVERMAELISPDLLEADASLANLNSLTEYVEWMNGIQYYLTEDLPIARGHTICVDSPWALTLVSQPQFWKAFDLTKYGDGTVKGLLSVDISDWDVKGFNGKEARSCSREEIALETWAQLKKSLNVGEEVLRDSQLHSWFLDPDIEDLDAAASPSTMRSDTNAEPLLVNYVDTWRMRPEAVTRIPNFFLASDYVRTYTDLATMEGANEAARRAVNGVIAAARSDAEPCQIWNLHEPELFVPLRAYDRVRYRKGLPWDGQAMDFARSVLNLAAGASRLSGAAGTSGPVAVLQENLRQILSASPELMALNPGVPLPPAYESMVSQPIDAASGDGGPAGEVAAEARASSDEGLRRWRIRSGS
jgi:uncharacterized protein with NAD-binding domain and iron-sulfur cluster